MLRFAKAVTPLICVMMLMSLMALPSCGKQKLSQQQKTLIATAAAAAKDRASSFAAISAGLAPIAAADQQAVAAWIGSHQDGLNQEAAALANLQTAAGQESGFSKQVQDELKAMATTAQVRIQLFNAMVPKLNLSPALQTWAAGHVNSLQSLATALQEFVNLSATATKTGTSTSTGTGTSKSP